MNGLIGSGGALIVDKPEGMTSHDVVGVIRKLFCTKSVGHTGTLDPMASGVMICLAGRAVKASEYLVSDSKDYVSTLRFGVTTDSRDVTGRITGESRSVPSLKEAKEALKEFRGEIMQTPPMYSAIKIGGKKLVDLARKGIEVERTPRPVRVDRAELFVSDEKKGEYRLELSVSKGTYVRTLITDLGEKLGCGAVMTSLRRTRCGVFSLKDAYTLDGIEKCENRASLLLPVEKLFEDKYKLVLPGFFEKLARCGNEIYLKKIGVDPSSVETGQLVRLCSADSFFALGEVREYEDGIAVKPVKQFEIL